MLCSLLLCGCCAPEYIDGCSFSYARGRYALIGRFSYRTSPVDLASHDLGIPVPRTPARLLVCFLFPSHVTFTLQE